MGEIIIAAVEMVYACRITNRSWAPASFSFGFSFNKVTPISFLKENQLNCNLFGTIR